MDTILPIPKDAILIKKIIHPDLIKLKQSLMHLEMHKNMNNLISTNLNILDSDEYKDLKAYFEKEITEYVANFYYDFEVRESNNGFEGLQITKSWVNTSLKGDEHHEHMHSFSVISGVLFLTNSEDNGNLTFIIKSRDLPYGDSMIGTRFHTLEYYATPKEQYLEDHLVLFPSDIPHKVITVQGDIPRHTMSFNTWWLGRLGYEDSKLGKIYFNRLD